MRSSAAIYTVRYVPGARNDQRPRPRAGDGHFLSPSAWLSLDWMAAVVGFLLAELEIHGAGGLRPLRTDAVLALLASLPVGLRRRFPLPVLVLVGLSTAALAAQSKAAWALSAMLALAGYTAALQQHDLDLEGHRDGLPGVTRMGPRHWMGQSQRAGARATP
jgi:hypothetical protein